MPDIITFRDMPNGSSRVALIDGKATSPKWPHTYSIETAAIETALIYCDHLYTPTFFIFSDWKGITPLEAKHRGKWMPYQKNSGGSGTPFVVVDRELARPFENFFPDLTHSSQTPPWDDEAY